ncbi:hypothetical protein VNO77_41751 [Canavalia gladiata]|uniref:Uncharacterized protein n=1 Tax=Canavalia gladiata TaxID=3824 RepID=A0AAN9K2W3_CANGL
MSIAVTTEGCLWSLQAQLSSSLAVAFPFNHPYHIVPIIGRCCNLRLQPLHATFSPRITKPSFSIIIIAINAPLITFLVAAKTTLHLEMSSHSLLGVEFLSLPSVAASISPSLNFSNLEEDSNGSRRSGSTHGYGFSCSLFLSGFFYDFVSNSSKSSR